MKTAGEQGVKASAQPDRAMRELLQLHRSAVQQGDTDISDQFETCLRKYCETLQAGPPSPSPLTREAILDYAGMHGLISPRRQQWEWSKVFNEKLVGFVDTVIAAAARCGVAVATTQRPPAGVGLADAWVSVTDHLPPFDSGERVLIYTEGADFGGEQYFDIKADDLYPSMDGEADARTEVATAASHWMWLPRPARASQAQTHTDKPAGGPDA